VYGQIRRLAAHGVLVAAGDVLTYQVYAPGAGGRLVLETVSIERAELELLVGELEGLVSEVEVALRR